MTGRVQERGGVARMRRRQARRAPALAIVFISLIVAIQSLHAQTFSVLYTFTGKGGDNPPAGLVRDSAGNLYGTSASGGNSVGTVLKLSLGQDGAWKETVLYRFPSGFPPEGLLTLDSASNLYGTTTFGGGGGTVFKITKSGKETLLYSFCSLANCADGSGPNGGMVRDAAGTLYGTTILGGNGGECCGTVFKLTKTGKEAVLYSFCSVANCADGAFPVGGGETFPFEGLVRDASGSLYGTTPNGGNAAFCGDDRGCGTVFKVDTTGKETVLYNFCSVAKCADGLYPETALIQDAAGNLYGTTSDGGEHLQYGTVFKVDTTGRETVLYSFPGRASVGEVQPSALVMDAAGNLYGTTVWGGAFHEGSVYEVNKSGQRRTLHSFTDGTDGGNPFGLVLDSEGNLYGTTLSGGNLNDCDGMGCGTLFELTP